MPDVNEKVDSLPDASLRDQNQPISTQPKKNTKKNAVIAVVIILAIAYLGRSDIANLAEDIDLFSEEIPETILNPADVHLYTFSDPYDNESVNVELWLINIGEETATEIEVYVRVRNHNGSILFSEVIDTTTLLLRENETCSGAYEVEYDDTEYLIHTVELSWDGGRKAYSKKTTILT